MSERKGIISKIQDLLTFGYSSKENLREFDKKLRDSYHEEFRIMRHKWEELYLEALNEQATLGREFKSVIQTFDRISAQIQRADYGYAGLFDRKGSVSNEGLSKVLEYDRGFSTRIDSIQNSIGKVKVSLSIKDWGQIRLDLDNIKDQLEQVEEVWRTRENLFR